MRWLVPILVLLLSCNGDDVVTDATSGDESETRDYPPMRLESFELGSYVREIRGACRGESGGCVAENTCETAPVDCGGEDVRFRVTARWESSDDVDLFVTDERGDTLSFLRPDGFTGGTFVGVSGRSCLPGRTDAAETATFVGPDVATGAYEVTLQHFGSCMSGLGTVDVDVTVSAGGHFLRAFRATLAPRDRVDILRLVVAE